MNEIILASNSPRRREILETYIKDFKIVSPNCQENFSKEYDIRTNIMSISREKARSVGKKYPDSIVIAADTLVIFKGEIFSKPKDESEAKRYLKLLSSEVHEVVTAFTIEQFNKDISICDYEVSSVKFSTLSDEIISSYLERDEWKDKAGGYGIQGQGAVLIDSIVGDYYNIVGLPINKTYNYLLKYFNLNLLR